MQIIVITENNHDSLAIAIDLSNQKSEVKIVLLSDAVYMINEYMTPQQDLEFYALKEDLDKRMDDYLRCVVPIEYGDFVDMIMADGSTVVNL